MQFLRTLRNLSPDQLAEKIAQASSLDALDDLDMVINQQRPPDGRRLDDLLRERAKALGFDPRSFGTDWDAHSESAGAGAKREGE